MEDGASGAFHCFDDCFILGGIEAEFLAESGDDVDGVVDCESDADDEDEYGGGVEFVSIG